MQTCETCQHWHRLDEPQTSFMHDAMKTGPSNRTIGWGECEVETPLASIGGRHVRADEFLTRADFGCVAHEPRA